MYINIIYRLFIIQTLLFNLYIFYHIYSKCHKYIYYILPLYILPYFQYIYTMYLYGIQISNGTSDVS